MFISRRLQSPQVSPLIARILGDATYYSDGPPNWTNAPTSLDAFGTRQRYVRRLRRFASDFPHATPLADILASCNSGHRCKSGACPECCRAFQRWFVSEVEVLADDYIDDPHSISVIFLKHRTAEDQLTALDTTKMKRSITEVTKKVDGLVFIAGGIDLSLNDDTQKNHGTAWQPQLYAIVQADIEKLSKVLRNTYSPTEIARRPVQIKECDGSERTISYAFKTEFVQRIAYQKELGPPENRRRCWDTRKVSLRAREHVQAMLWMHKVGLGGRLFLRGVRMTRDRNSVRLVQMEKPVTPKNVLVGVIQEKKPVKRKDIRVGFILEKKRE